MLGTSITRNSLILSAFALATAAVLAMIYASTATRIAEQERMAAASALLEIVPRSRHDNELLDTVWPIPAAHLERLHLHGPENIHVAMNQGKVMAVLIPAIAPDGYSGDIKMLVGINVDGSIAGVRVLSHKETPGLGDKVSINKSDWIFSFNGRSLGAPKASGWAVKKDGGEFDQFTGATITPRAVVNQVHDTLEYFAEIQSDIVSKFETVSHD